MKRPFIFTIICIGFFIPILVVSVYFFSYGLPWKREEVKTNAVEYLKKQYKQPMVVYGSGYDFKSGTYFAKAVTQKKPLIYFTLYIDYNGEVNDFYPFELWKYQSKKDLSPFLKKLYPNFKKMDAIVFPQREKHFAPKSDIPNYKNFSTLMELTIWVNKTPKNVVKEYKKAFELLIYTRENLKENKLNLLDIYYKGEGKDIHLTEDELKHAQSSGDIERYVKQGPV